jgi:hypothetical protein
MNQLSISNFIFSIYFLRCRRNYSIFLFRSSAADGFLSDVGIGTFIFGVESSISCSSIYCLNFSVVYLASSNCLRAMLNSCCNFCVLEVYFSNWLCNFIIYLSNSTFYYLDSSTRCRLCLVSSNSSWFWCRCSCNSLLKDWFSSMSRLF